MPEVKIDNLSIKVAIDGTDVKGSIDAKIADMNAFLTGYCGIVRIVMDMQLKDGAIIKEFGQKLALAYQTVAFEDAREEDPRRFRQFRRDLQRRLQSPCRFLADKDGKVATSASPATF